MRRVLVSGAPALLEPVDAALRDRGATVTAVVDLAEIPAVCRTAGVGAFDSYVQLPAAFQARGDTAVQRVHHFYASGVLARFPALDAARPALAPSAWITFVLGHLPPEAATPEDRTARRALTGVLSQAVRADAPDSRLTIRILDSGTPPADIAFVALGGDLAKQELMDRLADLDYADWRVELLGLAALET
jgi:hypothetical protein